MASSRKQQQQRRHIRSTIARLWSYGLLEFEVRFRIRMSKNIQEREIVKPAGASYEESQQWYWSGQCSISGMRGPDKDPKNRDEWWLSRRGESFGAPRDWERLKSLPHENRVGTNLPSAGGARSDWGVSIDRNYIYFGYGHRDFGYHGTERDSARPIRDTTARFVLPHPDALARGYPRWHSVRLVRRARLTNEKSQHFLENQDTTMLELWLDDEHISNRTMFYTGGKAGDAAAFHVNRKNGGPPAYSGSAPPHALYDAPLFPKVECSHTFFEVRDLEIIPIHSMLYNNAPPKHSPLRHACQQQDQKIPYALYYSALSDPPSQAMAHAFEHSLHTKDAGRIIFKQVIPSTWKRQADRYSSKLSLVLQAIKEALESAPNNCQPYLIISDLDIRFLRPVAKIIDHMLLISSYPDIIFQRDQDTSLQANLGFMLIRASQHVAEFFVAVARVVARGRVGDQRLVNRALGEPWLYGAPRLRWNLFPSEFITNSIVYTWRTDNMYGSNPQDWLLFHANEYGRDTLDPAAARRAKLGLLKDAQALVAKDILASKHAHLPSSLLPTRVQYKKMTRRYAPFSNYSITSTRRWPSHGLNLRPNRTTLP